MHQRSVFKLVNCSALCLLGMWLLGGCVSAVKRSSVEPAATVGAADYPTDLQGARLYRIAPSKSQLHVLVYRAGSMAQLGHNHVMSSNTVSGYVWLHDSLTRSGFSLLLPINDLIIDDPQARMAEGSDFSTKVTDEARAGTRRNMLKPEVLDGERYPAIRLRSMTLSGTREAPEVQVQITIKDQTRQVTVPVRLSLTPQSLRATGQFDIRQSEFGVTPYSALGGALQVRDQLTIKFDLMAVPR